MIDDAFSAKRSERLNDFSDEIRSIVQDALDHFGSASWFDAIVDGASVLWLEIFESHKGGNNPDPSLQTFRTELAKSLAKTSEPSQPPTEGEVNRVVNWIGVYTVNSATYRAGVEGTGTRGMTKTWVTMHDSSVRDIHSAVDGQTVPIRGTFTVAGEKLLFPGEPVGNPEVWINCRCLVRIQGGKNMSNFALNLDVDDPDTELDEAVDLDGEELVDDVSEIPWHGVLTVEGVPSGDRRQFEVGGVTYRDFPLPLKWQRAGAEAHAGDVVIGTIDEIWLEGNEHRARGRINLNVPEANEVVDGVVFGMLGGVSVEIDDYEVEVDLEDQEEGDESGLAMIFGGGIKLTRFTKARLTGATVVATPAYQEGRIALGPDFDEEVREVADDEGEVVETIEATPEQEAALTALFAAFEADSEDLTEPYALLASAFAPGTKDGPGWITNPRATSRIRRYWTHGKGAAKIRWGVPGDFNRCRRQLGKYVNPAFLAGTCANMHKEAIDLWPGREGGKKGKHAAAPAMALLASGAYVAEEAVLPLEHYEDPHFKMLTPLTVTNEGRIMGHLAAWGTCHIGLGTACITAPHSRTNYRRFRLGLTETTGGDVFTGVITLGTGHAGEKLSAPAAAKHYDDTGYAMADVMIGEDTFGIWFSGTIRPGLSAEQMRILKASTLSGDWRWVDGNYELVGALAVNAPGYAIPRVSFAYTGGQQISLLGAGIVMRKESLVTTTFSNSAVVGTVKFDAEMDGEALQRVARATADEIEYRNERRERIANAKDPSLLDLQAENRENRIEAAKGLGV